LAGHILLAVLLSFIGSAGLALGFGVGYIGVGVASMLGSVAINLLEIFVAFLQAFIFTFLTTLFIGQAVNIEHHGDEEHGEHAHAH
ncbi:MAG: F0F1 ATP synthase subunit A, partial [Planctomycetota bacterium]